MLLGKKTLSWVALKVSIMFFSPLCLSSPILDLPLANSQMQPLLCSGNEELLPGCPPLIQIQQRGVTVYGGDRDPAPPFQRNAQTDVHTRTRSSILWPEMYRKIEPQRTPTLYSICSNKFKEVLQMKHTHTRTCTHTHINLYCCHFSASFQCLTT